MEWTQVKQIVGSGRALPYGTERKAQFYKPTQVKKFHRNGCIEKKHPMNAKVLLTMLCKI